MMVRPDERARVGRHGLRLSSSSNARSSGEHDESASLGQGAGSTDVRAEELVNFTHPTIGREDTLVFCFNSAARRTWMPKALADSLEEEELAPNDRLVDGRVLVEVNRDGPASAPLPAGSVSRAR